MLHSQAPQYCTAQRFNLFLATTLTTKVPMPGMVLVNVCKGTPVNPFVLGCIASVLSHDWVEPQFGWDLFNRGAVYSSEYEAVAYALKEAMICEELEKFSWLTDEQVLKVKDRYQKFVRFAQKMNGGGIREPIVIPKPIPVPEPKPVPVLEPAPNPEPKPEPKPLPVNPQPVPQPAEKVILPVPKWKVTTKRVLTLIALAVTTLAIFIPDYIEVPLKMLINFILSLLG